MHRSLPRLLFCVLLAGCADLPAPPAELDRAGWGRVAIVPVNHPPQSNFRVFAAAQESNAGTGAATGVALGVAGTGVFAATTPLATVIAPYLAAIAIPVGAAFGALSSSPPAISAQDAAALESHIQQNLASLQAPATLARAIAHVVEQDTGRRLDMLADAGPAGPGSVPDYRLLARKGIEDVLEVVVSDIGFLGGKEMSFYLVANIRMVRTADGRLSHQRQFVYQSDDYDGRLWARNQAALFQAELQRAYSSLADSVVEHVFLLTTLPLESQGQASGDAVLKDLLGGREACGLGWVSPERDYRPGILDARHRDWNRFPVVASGQPALAWEEFPRKRDQLNKAGINFGRISNIRYDLRIWEATADAPPRLIHELRDLLQAAHLLEQPLPPGGRYFWSPRARFDLDGRTHATRWGCFRTPYYETSSKVKAESSPGAILGVLIAGGAPRDVCTLDFIPLNNYYRFRTP